MSDLLSKLPRPDLPAELLVAWTVWVLGGLLLMIWFTRRSAAPRRHDVAPPPLPAPTRLSGVHAAARPASGVRSVGGTTGTKPASSVRVRDAYSELSSLLDAADDDPTSRTH